MKLTIMPIVIGAFGTVTKGLLKGLEDLEVGGRVETIQTTALLKMARILRRVLGIEETSRHSISSKRSSAYADVKNYNNNNNNNNDKKKKKKKKKKNCFTPREFFISALVGGL